MNTRSTVRRSFALALAATFVSAIALVPSAHATTTVPYTDPAAKGIVGLCNSAGQSVASGSINTKPFIWRAIASSAAPAGYTGAGRTATLYAYQPRENVPPAEWSGAPLTASSTYTSTTFPMAASTQGDDSLADYIADFAPQWDGLLQLRMIVGAPDQPVDTLGYAATDIKVSGDTWTVVRGGTVACDSGKAVSLETAVGLKQAKHGAPAPTSSSTASSAGTKGSDGSAAATTAATVAAGATSAAAGSTSSGGSSNGRAVGLLLGLVVLVAVVAAVVALRRRRGAAP